MTVRNWRLVALLTGRRRGGREDQVETTRTAEDVMPDQAPLPKPVNVAFIEPRVLRPIAWCAAAAALAVIGLLVWIGVELHSIDKIARDDEAYMTALLAAVRELKQGR
jgi:hypothetical protein